MNLSSPPVHADPQSESTMTSHARIVAIIPLVHIAVSSPDSIQDGHYLETIYAVIIAALICLIIAGTICLADRILRIDRSS